MDNIRYNSVCATDEDVERAAEAVGAHEFIRRLEDGSDTTIQQRGGNRSVVECQLISFARALVADPRILILDKPTANIDTHSEILIQQALDELMRGRTSVVIAHRLSTVENADRIVVVDQGRIVEQGTHEQIMSLGGLYSALAVLCRRPRRGVASDQLQAETTCTREEAWHRRQDRFETCPYNE